MFYKDKSEIPWDLQKYYQQRHQIFSKYDMGVWMTEDAWCGVTPEPVANKIAKHVSTAAAPGKTILIDCFAGVGGNVIAFALSGRWEKIYAIEKDPEALACAKHNAEIYGVTDQVYWYEGDCYDIIENDLKGIAGDSVIFASPPWGGPSYGSVPIFDLLKMQPYSLPALMNVFQELTDDIILYLPRTSDLRQLSAYVKDASKMVVVHYCMNGASKAICAFTGSFNLTAQSLNE